MLYGGFVCFALPFLDSGMFGQSQIALRQSDNRSAEEKNRRYSFGYLQN